MATIIENRSENQIPYTTIQSEEDHLRVLEEVAQQYRTQIEELNQQIHIRSMNKIFKECNGVPKQFMSKIKTMIMGKSSKCCSICCNPFEKGETIMNLPCKHIFHDTCAKPWLRKSKNCPNCRKDVVELLKTMQ